MWKNWKKYIITTALTGVFMTAYMKSDVYAEDIIVEIPDTSISEDDLIEVEQYSENGFVYNNASFNAVNQINNYKNDYGYTDLSKRSNSAARQQLYIAIESVCDAYAVSNRSLSDMTTYGGYIVGKVNFKALGLTTEEAIETYVVYKYDNPEYFWLDGYVAYDSAGNLYVTSDAEYASYDVRRGYENLVNNKIKEYVNVASVKTSDYDKVKAVHDYIINKVDYAYDKDGNPLTTNFAHNILGVFDESNAGAVCESYAKAFSVVLNAMDIDNVYVVGVAAGGGHAWNLAKMDAGAYYNFDVTWDDGKTLGPFYSYFARGEGFLVSHTPNTPANTGVMFMYDVPSAPANDFDPSSIVERPSEEETTDSSSGGNSGIGDSSQISKVVKTIIPSYASYIDLVTIPGAYVQGHTANVGWGDEADICGVSGYELQAIRCVPKDANNNVYYRCYVDGYGWLAWAKNGEISGTVGLSKKIDKIQYIVTKNKQAPDMASDVIFKNVTRAALYKSHVQDHGDMGYCIPGTLSGTTGESRRIEGFYIESKVEGLGFHMKGHIQINGDVSSDNGYIGTKGESKRLEALTITLTGNKASQYNLYYKGHVQNDGWSDYKKAGEMMGTNHQSKRLEGIILIIENKSTQKQ